MIQKNDEFCLKTGLEYHAPFNEKKVDKTLRSDNSRINVRLIIQQIKVTKDWSIPEGLSLKSFKY